MDNQVLSFEEKVLTTPSPLETESQEVININGNCGIWMNKNEESNWKSDIPLSEYPINIDLNPEIVIKKNPNVIEYVQQVSVRYLKPPTPEPEDEIVINEVSIPVPPAPPIIIRQHPNPSKTPEPIVIREAPPNPPCSAKRQIITIPGKKLPPPPRKVIIERLPVLPEKPQSVIVERWLAYPKLKRRVVYKKSSQVDPAEIKPRNLIIQWDSPKLVVKKELKYLGIIKANPDEYVKKYGQFLKSSSRLPNFVHEIKPPENVTLAANYKPKIELYGDVEALKMVDLDKENLSEYREFLTKIPENKNQKNTKFANNYKPKSELTETVKSSNIVDLNKENLVERKDPATSILQSVTHQKDNDSSLTETTTIIEKLYDTLEKDENGQIKIEYGKKIIDNFKKRIGNTKNNPLDNKEKNSLISKHEFIQVFLTIIS